MALRPRLVLVGVPYQSHSLFHSAWFADLIQDHFDIEHYAAHQTYPASTVFVMGCNHYQDPVRRAEFQDRRVIVDALWESNTAKWAGCGQVAPDHHMVFYGNQANAQDARLRFVPAWFWYNESLWYQHRGYAAHVPERNIHWDFLMPLGKARGWRDHLVQRLGPRLNSAMWSYVAQNRLLPGTLTSKRMDSRWFNADWYNATGLSLVAESFRSPESAVVFLTEKTYKTLAAQHVFMIYAASGVLDLLRSQGFVTHDHLLDESYDCVDDFDRKLDIILDNLDRVKIRAYDAETQHRVQHNVRRFYDRRTVTEGIITDILEPMQAWIAAT